jgi:hypothetical protein
MMTSDTAALDAGALQRRLDGDLAEFMRRQVGESAVEAPTGVRAAPTMTMSSCINTPTGGSTIPAPART